MPLSSVLGSDPELDEWCLSAGGASDTFTSLETLLTERMKPKDGFREDFVNDALSWLLDPESPSLSTFIERSKLSHRQIDRLVRRYFGGSPKSVYRVYRALNIAYRLCTEEGLDWTEVAGSYFDQAHFSKDFKDRMGYTLTEFVGQRQAMIRFDISKRLEINHRTRFSLIA